MTNIDNRRELEALTGGLCIGLRQTIYDNAGNAVRTICHGIALFE